MNYFFKKSAAILLSLSLGISASAATEFSPDMRILTPPVWMPNDILIDNENLPVATDNIMQSQNKMGFAETYNGNKQKFTNFVDGYSIVIPGGMKTDTSLSDVCTIFTDSNRELRVFKESFDTASERLSYLNYSNKFIENTVDHKLEKQENFVEGNFEYYVLQWSRNKLKNVSNDKNYYACVDVCTGARVYTFFFTSSLPFEQYGGYMDIVKSLITFDPSVPEENAYNKGYNGKDISRLNTYAKATYNNLFADSAEFKMGLFPPDKFGGFKRMEEFEKELGYKFCAFLVYTEFTDIGNNNTAGYDAKVSEYMKKIEKNFQYARKTGKAIELTLQSPLQRGENSSNMMYEILNGKYDSFISAYTKLISSYPDVTVLFRPFNEMNGDWCNYSSYHTSRDPEIYVEVYKYLHQKFNESGCDNTLWVWNPNELSFPGYKWNDQVLYYPGDEYVDIYGITGYNTGTYYEGETWRSFDEVYAPIYEKVLRLSEKPVMITEFSCSAIGGDKLLWIEDMFNSLPKYDRIKVGIWWHATDYDGENLSRPYFFDTPDGTLDIFDKYLN